MRATDLKFKILSLITALSVVILVLMPFHAFLSVWGSAIIGHYTILRLWKELVLAVCIAGALYLLFTNWKQIFAGKTNRLLWLIIAYALVNIIWGIVAYFKNGVSYKALGFGLIINLRFLAFFLVTFVISKYSTVLKDNWRKILVWPSAIVIVFAIIQQLLPANFLEHFGYSSSTILPYQYVDNNSLFLRAQSTLRGANPLGAYLLIIITALLATTVLKQKRFSLHDLYNKKVLLTLSGIVAMYFTYSRSAWIGAFIASATLFVLTQYRKPLFKKLFVSASLAIIFLVGFIVANIEHNRTIENIVLHTSQSSQSPESSTSNHLRLFKEGGLEVLNEPLGRGTGSAGPASVYSNHPARISENYYIQIGQELGWIGLLIFISINLTLGYLLWLRRGDTLALTLFASLIGISFINLLLHSWTDDTLAYIWWGLAGIAMVDRSWKVEDGQTKKGAKP